MFWAFSEGYFFEKYYVLCFDKTFRNFSTNNPILWNLKPFDFNLLPLLYNCTHLLQSYVRNSCLHWVKPQLHVEGRSYDKLMSNHFSTKPNHSDHRPPLFDDFPLLKPVQNRWRSASNLLSNIYIRQGDLEYDDIQYGEIEAIRLMTKTNAIESTKTIESTKATKYAIKATMTTTEARKTKRKEIKRRKWKTNKVLHF